MTTLETLAVTVGDNWSMYDAKRLGHNVMIARRDMEMTQQALADAVGVSRAYVTNIERGRGENVGIDVVFGLADALGVPVPYLLGLQESAVPAGDEAVLRESGVEYIAVDVESREERRVLQQAVDLFHGLTAGGQAHALRYMATLRRMEDEGGRVAGRVDAGEVDGWVELIRRFDEPTRSAIERLVGAQGSDAGAGVHRSAQAGDK